MTIGVIYESQDKAERFQLLLNKYKGLDGILNGAAWCHPCRHLALVIPSVDTLDRHFQISTCMH